MGYALTIQEVYCFFQALFPDSLLQLQGEMLKAMGDVMVKYGQTLRDAQ
jgi:hypothetical protein